MPPVVSLIGRPNVGKSTLFNRLIRANRAITHDRPGVTRDRMYGEVRGAPRPYTVCDTGGVTLDARGEASEGPRASRGFEKEILQQAAQAMEESVAVLLVVDGRDGLHPLDDRLAVFLRQRGKPVLLVVNKVDGAEQGDIMLAEFHALGLDLMGVSAAHGYNLRYLRERIDDLLVQVLGEPEPEGGPDEVEDGELADVDEFSDDDDLGESVGQGGGEPGDDGEASEPAAADVSDADGSDELAEAEFAAMQPAEDAFDDLEDEAAADAKGKVLDRAVEQAMRVRRERGLKLAMLGRPNAGKSSLVNAIIGKQRMIVSDIAGTTRDSVDVAFESDGSRYTFVDTAGVRRKARINDQVESYSVHAALKTSQRADVALLVLDCLEGLAQQDKRLINFLDKYKIPFVVLLNKIDQVERKDRPEMLRAFEHVLRFCPHVPVIQTSAVTRAGLAKILPLVEELWDECHVRATTGQINRAARTAIQRHQPPMVKGRRAKFYYLTQAEVSPPTFVFFVNDQRRIRTSYARYLENNIRKFLGIKIAPMRLLFRPAHRRGK